MTLTKNEHERCSEITFDEPSHTYNVKGKKVGMSVTTFVHKFFEKFDPIAVVEKYYNFWQRTKHPQYYGLTKDEILLVWENERDLGTELHFGIECYYNDEVWETSEEILIDDFAKFLQFDEQKGELEPFRTEMRVWDEDLDLAGSVDMMYKKPNGKIAIYDWKRTKKIDSKESLARGKFPLQHMPDTNYWHYALQLNVYKYILEKNYGYEVDDLCLVQIHPNYESYKLHMLPDLQKEVGEMIKER